MKKIKLGIIILGIFILTGCVKYDLQMTVEGDKGFSITIIDAMQKEYYTEDTDNTSIKEYEALGYKVENYQSSTHTGLKLTKEIDNIDLVSSATCGQVELTSLLGAESKDIILFKSSKQGTITTYVADFTYDLTIESTSDSEEEIDYSEYASSMDFSYSISLPSNATVISSNAKSTSANGHVLTWKMEYGKKEDIDFSFSIDESKQGETILKDDEPTIEEEKDEDPIVEEESTENVTPQKEEFSFKTLILTLFTVVIVLGLILLKIKMYNQGKSNTKNTDKGLGHTQPPNIKK